MNDLIEKLSNLRSQFNCFDENKRDAYHVLSEAIKVLSEYPQPCEDAVSRTDMLETYADLYDIFEDNGQIRKELNEVYDKLNALSSVTPKRKKGKWIEYDSDEDKYDVIKCPCCKHTFIVDAYHWTDIGSVKDDFKFCPNCGANMRQREENK